MVGSWVWSLVSSSGVYSVCNLDADFLWGNESWLEGCLLGFDALGLKLGCRLSAGITEGWLDGGRLSVIALVKRRAFLTFWSGKLRCWHNSAL